MPSNTITLGEFIRLKREEKKILQQDLADKSGCTVTYLSLLENNKKTASIKLLKKISKNLGYQLEEFLMLWFLEKNPNKKFSKESFLGTKAVLKEVVNYLA
ncbi:MAG TPA: helix-turn-helix transcriptional regulator [Candidatus Paceibacterota bacterium]|nr:helix-turn-helix transcriptional regulator [Candidatus Paceibacterota bacterium]